MSVFAGHDISLNKYHYVFYSFSKSEQNTLKAQFYDSGQNLLGTQNISFSQRDIPAMLTFLENSQSNPYALGKSPSGFRNMDIAFSGIYKKTLKDSQQQSLMTYVNKKFKNVYSNAVTVYDVKVNGFMKYLIDDVEQPNLLALQTGIYVFDQSDPSNGGHRLKFRNLSDSTPYTTNVIHEGTPGTPNSYSIIDVTQATPDLEYYCEIHTVSMYGEFKTLTDLTSYRVKVETNVLGDPVFALSPPGTDEYYNQIDVSFGAGSKFLFDVSDPTMADISFVFGTTVDNSSTMIDSFVTYQDGLVMLDICSGYVGETLKYFEDTSAGMGYNMYDVSVETSFTTISTTSTPYNITCSSNGQYVYSKSGSNILKSIDYGLTYNVINTPISGNGIITSEDGQNICIWDGFNFATSTDYGNTFSSVNTSNQSIDVISITGQYICRIAQEHPVVNKKLYVSNNYGSTFTELTSDNGLPRFAGGQTTIQDIKMSTSGQYIMISANEFKGVIVSDNYGASFSLNPVTGGASNDNYGRNILMSPNGRCAIHLGVGGPPYNPYIYTNDYGVTWYPITVGSGNQLPITPIETDVVYFSYDGTHIYYIDTSDSNKLYYSNDSGLTYSHTPVTRFSNLFSLCADNNGNIHSSVNGANEIKRLYSSIPPYIYNVTVSGEPFVFYLSGIPRPNISFNSGTTYIFDLSHNSNAGNTLVLGTVPDSSTNLIDYQTVVGTPGQPGAYTTFTATEETVYYYSFETPDMGYQPPTYIVKTDTNVLGDTVFSIKKPGETEYYIQPDLSFGAGFVGQFDVSVIGSYSLVFGTEVDVSSTIQTQYFSQTGGVIVLSIPSDYSGNSLKYFEDTTAGMGYVAYTGGNTQVNVTTPTYYFEYRKDNTTEVTDVLGGLNSVLTDGATCNVTDGLVLDGTNDYADIDDMTIGGEMSFEAYIDIEFQGNWQRIFEFGNGPSNGKNIFFGRNGGNNTLQFSYRNSSEKLINFNTTGGVMHVVGTISSTHITLYKDGSYETTNTIDSVGLPNTTTRVQNYFGKSNWSSDSYYKGSIKYFRFWNGYVLTPQEVSDLYSSRLTDYSIQSSWVPKTPFYVTVSGDTPVFYIDGSANPNLTFTSGETYVFDLSHNSNAGNTLVLGTVPDSSTNLIDYQTIVGTPGQPGAYTTFTASGETVYYYSYETPDMGYEPPTYTVNTEINVLGDTVFSIKKPGETVYYAQPDLSFGAGFAGQFDVAQIAGSYTLVFGTEVDVSSSIQTQYFSQNGDVILLSIPSDYSGNSLKYFEDTSAGMGYVDLNGSTESNVVPTVLWYNFDTSTVTGINITNVADGSSLGDALMTRSSIVTDVTKTGTGSLLCVRDSGSSQYVTLPSLTLPSEFTICFWHKMTSDDNFATKVYLLYYLGLNTSDTYAAKHAIDIEVNNGKIHILLNHSPGESRYTYGTYPNDNEWHHLMFIKSSIESTFKVYLDNSEKQPDNDNTVNMGVFSTSTYNSHYISGRSDVNTVDYYHMGGHTDDYRFYDKALDSTERSTVYNYAPIELDNYTVDVSNGVFRLDSGSGFEETPQLIFTSGTTYKFDLSHNSNAGNTFVLGTVPDSSVNLIDYQTIVGTPGQPGSYTTFTASGETVYYYSFETPNMGYVESIVATNFVNTSVLTNIDSETYTLSGHANSFANGNYQISSTNNLSAGQNLYNIVRKYTDGYGTEYDWHSATDAFNPSYTGSEYTTAGVTDYHGEWVEITMPYKLVLKNLYIIGRNADKVARPKTVYMLGSNDGGTTYELIDEISDTGTVGGTGNGLYSSNTSITGVTIGYYTIRMVVNKLHGSTYNMVGYWELTGDAIK